MKKNTMKSILTFSICILTVLAVNAQEIFYDDFESYAGGIPTCEIWSSYSGDPNDGSSIIVVDDMSIDNLSGYVGPGSVQDILMNLQNQSSGDYTVRWEMYITAGSTGYFNIQGMTDNDSITGCIIAGNNNQGIFNSSNLFFNNSGGSPGIFEDATTGETGNYPEDQWFPVSIYFDLTGGTSTYEISINGNLVNQNPVPFQTDNVLGAINFFSIDGMNNYWIDNVLFTGGTLGIEDVFDSRYFGMSPNPVQNALNIRSIGIVEVIEVYDAMGRNVLSEKPERMSPTIDMSVLNSGPYLVKVTIDGNSKSFKVIK